MRTRTAVLLLFAKLVVAIDLAAVICVNCEARGHDVQKEDCANFSKVPIPNYRVAHQWHGDVKPMLFLFVNVKPKDISRDSVIALACHIGKRYSGEEALGLWILDDPHAAKVYAPAHEGNSGKTERALRATYEFYREKDSQFLDWRPDPSQVSKWIHIDLGKAPVRARADHGL